MHSADVESGAAGAHAAFEAVADDVVAAAASELFAVQAVFELYGSAVFAVGTKK